MQVTTIGLDLAKNIFNVHGVDAEGNKVIRKRLARSKLPRKPFKPLQGGVTSYPNRATSSEASVNVMKSPTSDFC